MDDYINIKNLLFSFLLSFIFIQTIFAVNICPIDKNPTEITIEHSRHPINIPLGITDNSIDVTVQLNAIDRKTGTKIPLANKELLFELTIGSKFITKDLSGNFVLSDEPSPFPINTSENGTVHFTIFTQPPLLENSTDPRKISYSITASFTPKPKEPLTGSVKTERYVPGVFPIISMAACAPLLIIFGLLIAAMFAAGKNPFGLFDFSRVAFKAPGISGGRVTQRQKTTLVGVAATAAQGTLSTAAKTGLYKAAKKIMEKTEPKKDAKGLVKLAQKALAMPGKILMVGASRPLTAQELKKLKDAQKSSKEKVIDEKTAEQILGQTGRVVKGPLGGLRIVTADETLSKSSLLYIFKTAFLGTMGQLGQRPWSLSYAAIPQLNRASEKVEKVYSKEEQQEIKEKVNKTYGINLEIGKDIDTYGLTEKGKEKLIQKLDLVKTNLMLEKIKELNDLLKQPGVILKPNESQRMSELIESIKNEIKKTITEYSTPAEIKEKESLIKKISVRNINELTKNDINELTKNVNSLYEKELLNKISSNGALIGFDKEKLILLNDKIKWPQYFSNYGLDEMKIKSEKLMLLADAHGISYSKIANAFESGDPNKINEALKENLEKVKDKPESLLALNYILKEVQIGTMMRYINNIEVKDENGNLIKDPATKISVFLKTDYDKDVNKEILTKNVIQTLVDENKISKSFEKTIKIVLGEKSDVKDINNMLYTVMNGEKEVENRIKNIKEEISKLEKEYPSATVGSIGYEKIQDKKKELDAATNDLIRVKNGIDDILKERENFLLITKEMYRNAKEISRSNDDYINVVAPNVESLFLMKKVGEANDLKTAEETTREIISANLYTYRKIDALVKELNEAQNAIPGEPEKRTKLDNVLEKGLRNITEKYNDYMVSVGLPSSNYDIFEKKVPEKLEELSNTVSKAIDDAKYEIKRQGVITREEESRYNKLIDSLNEVNKQVEDAHDRIKKQIDKHIDINRSNELSGAVDIINYDKFTEERIEIGELKEVLKNHPGNNTILYYYSEGKGIDKEINEGKDFEEKTYVNAFFGNISKIKQITIKEGEKVYSASFSKNNESKK